jgi:hypothetical protein
MFTRAISYVKYCTVNLVHGVWEKLKTHSLIYDFPNDAFAKWFRLYNMHCRMRKNVELECRWNEVVMV